MRRLLALFTFLTLTLPSLAQDTGEPCFSAQKIKIPLDKEHFSLNNEVFKRDDLDLNLVYYQDEDEFTFWYELVVEEDTELEFKVAATNDTDDYDFLLYQYNGDNFCDTMTKKPLRPINKNVYTVRDENFTDIGKDGLAYLNKVQVKAGNTYYLAVLSLTPDDCGHKLYVTTNNETLIVSAVHNPCFVFERPPTEEELAADTSTTVFIQGIVFDQDNNEPIVAQIEIIDEATGKVVSVQSDQEKGYNVELKKNYTYQLKCTSFGYDDIYGVIEFYNSTVYNFYLPKVGVGNKVVMENIYFHPNTYAFKENSAEELERLWTFMMANPDVKIEIQGHTAGDTPVKEVRKEYRGKGPEWTYTGSAKKLSKMRAEAVKRYLVANGVQANRIVVKGYGSDVKRYPNPKSQEEYTSNMRVEIQITATGTRN